MATFHLALDAIDSDFTLATGYGYIVGMALSEQGLRDQGFGSGTYTGNRLSTIEHDASGFDANCERGWYRTPNGVQAARPMTAAALAIEEMIIALENLHRQLLEWDDDVTFHGPGHPDWQRSFAHDALASCHGHNYLVMTNTSHSVADRTTYCETLLAGASNGQGGRIASALQYYSGFTNPGFNTPRPFSDLYAERAGTDNPPTGTSIFYAWCDPATPGTALTLGALHSVQGTIPAGTVLGHGATWHRALTA